MPVSSRNARITRLSASPWLLGGGTFLVALALTLWVALPQWTATLFFGFPTTASIDELIPVLGLTDAGSYLKAAVDLQDGSMSTENRWVLGLWPPGMPVILATMVKLGGGASPVLGMVFLLCVLWSAVLATAALFLIPRRGYITFAIFGFMWVGTPIFTGWTIHDGVLGSDGLATALGTLVTIGLLWAAVAKTRERPRFLLFALLGLGLAALAHLRIMWFYAVPAALGVLAVIVLVRILVMWARGRKDQIRRERRGYLEWGTLAVMFVIACTPWTLYVGTRLHPGNFSWSTGDYQWAQLWMTDEHLNNNGAGFLENGGGNWPCDLDPQRCGELAEIEFSTDLPYGGQGVNSFSDFQEEALKVALTNPAEFIADRTEVTVETWLSVPGEAVGSYDNLGFGLATLAAFFASLVILVRDGIRRRSAAAVLVFLILGANIGVVWLTHFETRYVVPLQAISLIVVAFSIVPLEGRLWHRITARGRAQSEPVVDQSDPLSPDLPLTDRLP